MCYLCPQKTFFKPTSSIVVLPVCLIVMQRLRVSLHFVVCVLWKLSIVNITGGWEGVGGGGVLPCFFDLFLKARPACQPERQEDIDRYLASRNDAILLPRRTVLLHRSSTNTMKNSSPATAVKVIVRYALCKSRWGVSRRSLFLCAGGFTTTLYGGDFKKKLLAFLYGL